MHGNHPGGAPSKLARGSLSQAVRRFPPRSKCEFSTEPLLVIAEGRERSITNTAGWPNCRVTRTGEASRAGAPPTIRGEGDELLFVIQKLDSAVVGDDQSVREELEVKIAEAAIALPRSS